LGVVDGKRLLRRAIEHLIEDDRLCDEGPGYDAKRVAPSFIALNLVQHVQLGASPMTGRII
jgi:hypothetical protein